MLKKIIILIVLLFSFYSSWYATSDCSFNKDTEVSVSDLISGCLSKTDLVQSWGDLSVEGTDFKTKVYSWIKTIWGVLGLLAIGSIAYGWFMLVVSSWDDEKLKKWKDIVKWWILGFLWVVWASSLIAIVVKFIYAIG